MAVVAAGVAAIVAVIVAVIMAGVTVIAACAASASIQILAGAL